MSEFHGLSEDQILERIEGGESINHIALSIKVNRSTLCRWLDADLQRSARAKTSRRISAQSYDEKAESCIEEAADPFELSKAKELAHHYRWRASKIDPAYGDKVDHTHQGAVNMNHSISFDEPKKSLDEGTFVVSQSQE